MAKVSNLQVGVALVELASKRDVLELQRPHVNAEAGDDIESLIECLPP